MTARDRLNAELASLLEQGHIVACAVSGLATSEDPDERAQAVRDCRPCPLRPACGDVGREERHKWGVWGGVDVSPGTSPRPLRQPEGVAS